MSVKAKFKKLVNTFAIKFSDAGYVRYFVREKKSNTKHKLDKDQLKEASSYYDPYFKLNPVFHSFYTEKTGKYCVDYIPDDKWFTDIDRFFNNREKARVLDHKSYYEKMFTGVDVKHPETILHRVNNLWYNEKMKRISLAEVEKLVENEETLFVKVSSDSCGGRGVKYIAGSTILDNFKNETNNCLDVVVQKPIKQHPELYKVGANSINTLRIVSLLSKEGVKVYSAILRMGIGDAKVDNASSGGITCGIKENGQLKDVAYTMLGEKFDCHPTTKVKFSEVTIPSYKQVIKLVKELHPSIPSFRMVSWDIAIDENAEPILVEVNLCMGQLDFHQLNNGPIFKEDTKKILDEVFNKNKVKEK